MQKLSTDNVLGLGIHIRMPQSQTNTLDLANEELDNQEILLSLCAQDSATKYLVGGNVEKTNRSLYRRAAIQRKLIDHLVMITPRSFGLAVVCAPVRELVRDTLPALEKYPLPDFDAIAKRNVRIKQQSESMGMELEIDDPEKEVESFDTLVEKESMALRKAEMRRINEVDAELESIRYERSYFSQAYKSLAEHGVVAWIVDRALLDKATLDRFYSYFYDVQIMRFESDARLVFLGKRRGSVENGVNQEARAKMVYRFGLEPDPIPLVGELDLTYIVPAVAHDKIKMFRVGELSSEEIYESVQHSTLLAQELTQQLSMLSFDTVAPAPLQKGHLVQLLTSGVIDSYIGEGNEQHLVKGQSIKMISERVTSEEDTITTIKNDHYSVKLKLLLPDGSFHTIR